MIENEKQYQVTQNWLAKFTEALADVKDTEYADPLLKQLRIDAITSYIQEFEQDIQAYESRKK